MDDPVLSAAELKEILQSIVPVRRVGIVDSIPPRPLDPGSSLPRENHASKRSLGVDEVPTPWIQLDCSSRPDVTRLIKTVSKQKSKMVFPIDRYSVWGVKGMLLQFDDFDRIQTKYSIFIPAFENPAFFEILAETGYCLLGIDDFQKNPKRAVGFRIRMETLKLAISMWAQ